MTDKLEQDPNNPLRRIMDNKLTPEEIVEAICRLDAVELVRVGDVAQEKGMAERLVVVLEAAMIEVSIPRKTK